MALKLSQFQEGSYGKGGEVLDWSYYSSTILANGTTTHNLFTAATGQTFEGTAQSLDLTNMQAAGVIPQAQNFTVKNIKVMYATHAAIGTAVVANLYTMFAQTTVEFILTNKFSMGVWTLQELLGAASLVALTPTAAGDNIPLAQPRFHGIFPLNVPIRLAALTSFYIRVIHQTAHNASLNGDWLKLSLNGMLIRGS